MKNMKVKIFAAVLMILASGNVMAQQQVMFTQYMFNGLALNPAYAGSHDYLSVTALAREQWTGLDGAPSTQTLSLDAPVKKKNLGLGLILINDKIGVTNQTGLYSSYAYKIKTSGNSTLSLGLQGGFTYYKAAFSEISDTDEAFAGQDVSEFHPNFGFGAYFTTDRFYAGFSVPQLIQNSFDVANVDTQSKILRHYFLTAGYLMDLSPSLKLKPSLLVKAVSGAPVEFDINSNLIIKDVLWIGASWRSFDSFDALLQVQITDQLQFGYAYDFFTTSDLRRVQSGTHEFMLNYVFRFSKDKIITPRYF